MGLWYMAHFSFAFKLQQQDGGGQKKAQNNLKDRDNKCVTNIILIKQYVFFKIIFLAFLFY